MAVKNANPIGAMPTRNGETPCEGQKTIPFTFDFAAFAEFDVDLEQLQQAKAFTSAQCLYVDNSLNTSTLIIICGVTGQRVVFPKNACGYIPLLLATPATIQFQSAGAFVVGVQIMNFYIPPTIWTVV